MSKDATNEDRPYLSVIIPAYNEENRIALTLNTIYDYLCRQPYSWELLVALDGPTDDTLAVLEVFAKGKNHMRWLDRKVNRGKGYTLREAMLAAKGRIRLFTDADNSTDISHFERMKPYFDEKAQVVIASRDARDARTATQIAPQPFVKRCLGKAGNLIIQIFAVPGIWDTRCGFKAFSATAAEAVFPLARMNGWGIDDEILALSRLAGFKTHIVPAKWVDVEGSHVGKVDYLKNLLEVIKIRWNLFTGAYRQQVPKQPPTITQDIYRMK